jgi:hypothetical protein
LLAIIGAGAAVALAHGGYGMVFRVEQRAGLRDIDCEAFSRDEHGWVLWDLFLIEPWFFVEGIILWVAGFSALVTAREQRLWGLATAVLTVAAFISAVASLKAA